MLEIRAIELREPLAVIYRVTHHKQRCERQIVVMHYLGKVA